MNARTPDLNFDIRARDRTAQAFDSARNRARRFNGETSRMANGLRAAETAAKAFAAAFAITAVSRFAGAVRDAVGEASNLAKTADKVGLPIEALQQLRYIAEDSGVAVSAMDMGMQRFSRRVAEAANGSGELYKLLTANDVKLRDQTGKMRSQLDILRDFADLIKNAGSEQEQLLVSVKGFDSEGAALVNTFREGAAAIDRMAAATSEAGGVLDKDLVRRAEQLDHEFNLISRTVELRIKRNLLGVADVTGTIYSNVDQIAKRLEDISGIDLTTVFGTIGGPLVGAAVELKKKYDQLQSILAANEADAAERAARSGKGNRILSPTTRIAASLIDLNTTKTPDQQALIDALIKKFGDTGSGKPTIIPTKPGDGGKGISEAEKQAAAYQKVAEALGHELEMLGKSELQQRIMTEQRRAGVDAASDQGKAIAAMVTQIEEERRKLEALEEQQRKVNEASKWFIDVSFDAFDAMISGAESAEDAMKQLGLAILKAALYAMLFNEGPLAGLFGKGGGLFGGLSGAKAIGGPVNPWGKYIVGENGAEVLETGPYSGTVHPLQIANGGGSQGGGPQKTELTVIVNGARGNAEIREMALKGAEEALGKYDRHVLPARFAQISQNPRIR